MKARDLKDLKLQKIMENSIDVVGLSENDLQFKRGQIQEMAQLEGILGQNGQNFKQE